MDIKNLSNFELYLTETKTKLASTLSSLSKHAHPPEYFTKNIVRAHRWKGKSKDLVFIKFSNSEALTASKLIVGNAKQGVFVDQMRLPLVHKQISTALTERKALKQGVGKNRLIYVNDQVKLMVKKPR